MAWKGTDNSMIRVTKQRDETTEDMIKRFKRKCSKEGIIGEYRKRTSFQSPGERQRKKHYRAIRKAKKK